MFIAFVLICRVAAADCTPNNALTVLRVPGECMLPLACLQQAEAYFAAAGLELTPGEHIKIICSRLLPPRNVG